MEPGRNRPVLDRPEGVEGSPPATAPESFDDFYLREYPRVLVLSFALSGSRWAPEDLTQEAFLAAHREWQRISRYEQPAAWVRRVVANRAVSTIRRRVSEAKALARWWSMDQAEVPNLVASDPAFWAAVQSLPRRQAQAVTLFYLEDLSVDAVADILDVSPGTVKQHLSRARTALARSLSNEEGDQ
jgi:RNA polymerase sigma factor (sigma-70 family)